MKKTLLILLNILFINVSYCQIISNDCTSLTANWDFNSVSQESGYWLLNNASDFVISESFDLCPYNSAALTTQLRSFGTGSEPECTIEVSDDNGLTWTAASTTITSIPNSYTNYNFSFGPIASSTVKVRWQKTGGTRGLRINNIELTGSGSGSCGPPPDIILNSNNPASPAINIIEASNNNIVYAFNLSVSTSNALLSTVNINTTGTYLPSDFANFSLWYSTNSSLDLVSDILLDDITTSLSTGTHTFSNFSQLINNGDTGYLFITVDALCGANSGNTIAINAISTSDLTFSSGNKTGIAYSSDSHTIQAATPNNVTLLTSLNCENSATTINWVNPIDCYDTILVFATNSSFSSATPSGNGDLYVANSNYGLGTLFDGGFCVYNGTATSETITALTNGTNYTYKVFTKNDTLWSNGIEVSCSPQIEYCNAGPTNYEDSEIENVTLIGENNAINNNTTDQCSGGTSGIVNDYTTQSADLNTGGTYNLIVEFGDCDNGAQYDGAAGVWIDWNNDGDFDDLNEEIITFDIAMTATDTNVTENIVINVPGSQAIGNYRMRIMQEEASSASLISACNTFDWGSVEDYTIEVIAECTATHSITNFNPTSGPELSHITINGLGFTPTTIVTFNGSSANIISQTATTLIVETPNNSTSGNIIITEGGCSISSVTNFTVLDNSGSCIDSANFTDLIITEVYDSDSGNGWYIELYNPTNTPIDLNATGTDFEIERFGDIGDTTPTRTIDLIGTIAANSVFTLRIGSASPNPCNTTVFDFTEYNAGINENDKIRLTKNGIPHDVVNCPNNIGYSILRNTASSGPSTTYNATDWNTNTTESCIDLGTFILPSTLPSVSSINNLSDCNNTSFSITATPGNNGNLSYQWYYNNGASTNWTAVSSSSFSPGITTGNTSSLITISGYNLAGFQFYCKVTEDTACSKLTKAIQANSNSTTWSLGAWDNGTPSLTTQAIINDDYNTSINGNIEACSLTINPSYFLTVSSNTYVKIQNNITNNGTLTINDSGSVVQINDSGTYDDSGSSATNPTTVERLTASISDWYEYTYWSSPVTNETIGNALFQADANRRFIFIAANFVDSTYETNNDNTTTVGAGIDDIDDNGDDWALQPPGALMTPGVGYAATHSTAAFAGTNNYNYSFRGPLNNGVITVPVERNDTELGDSNWNLIGNPYPSAIDAKLFFDENTFSTNPATGTLDGAIHLWSHSTPPSSTANGNEILNFDLNDYIVINYTGSSVSGVTSHVASGQSFFTTFSDAVPTTTGTVTFNNSMRVDGNNNQFFRTSNQTVENKLWLKLTSDSGLKDNILIGYVNGATNGNDGDAYDAKANGSYTKSMTFYSLIPTVNRKFSIQGKAINDLDIDETIAIGFLNNLDTPTIYTFSIAELQGDFLINNTVYLKDNLTSTTFNLSDNDYSFTSPVGEFNSRFEIVFKDNSLSIDPYNLTADNLLIIEDSNNNVTFKLPNKNVTLKTIKIYDALGRLIYNLKAQNTSDTFNLSNLSHATYIAQIELSNGKIIRKKAIKK
ncbi:GEVED domain-containing protein [Olleya namhaensis]|uniref:GEVED domain-containing protein n=1 Tax=Olleya namhaensis TaxID=1144750 RepID=UPI002491DCF3|nr:GEVED domain-containing protein [Olleya namhaensis]